MNKKNLKLGIFIISLLLLITSVSYAYYQAFFKDERTENNTNLNTEFLSSNVEVKNISGVPGSFSGFDIYPGHKEVAGMEVKVNGENNSRIGVKFIYEVLENGLNDNVNIKLYKSKEKIETSSNYFNCQKQTEAVNGETRLYETCEEKNLELLIAERTLVGGEETIELVTDTVYVEDTEETYYYYVVVEFLNKEELQNEVMNRVLNGNIKVELGVPTNKTFEESVVAYGNLGNNIAKSMLYSSYLDKTNLAYDETTDNNLRYIGASPNNYVDFNGEKWRIIGVMNNVEDADGNKDSRIKLIRDESVGGFSWDSSPSNINNGYGVNEWSQADLKIVLNNGPYWNRTSGNCYNGKNNATKSCNFSSIGMKEETKSLISNIKWNIGSNGNADYTSLRTNQYYSYERSSNTGRMCSSGGYCTDKIARTTTWKGYIGLMYPSDFGYATSGGTSTSRKTCLNLALYNWNNYSNCYRNDWLYKPTAWTLTPSVIPTNSSALFEIWSDGKMHVCSGSYDALVYPSLYLNSDIKITSGNGSKENSYKLSSGI